MTEGQKRRGFDLHDIIGLAGVALVTAGSAMIYVPAGLIVCGSLLLLGAILAARRS